MALEREHIQEAAPPPADAPGADVIQRLARFQGPPEQFLASLLAAQCEIARAQGGAILRPAASADRVEVLAAHPPVAPGATPPTWIARAVDLAPQVFQSRQGIARPIHRSDDLYGQPAGEHLVLLPIHGQGQVRGTAAFLVTGQGTDRIVDARRRLELTMPLLSLYEMRLTLQRRQVDMKRLRVSMETLSAVGEQGRFTAAAMTLCNEVASRWDCDRVSLGMLRGRYVKLRATSHTEKFSRKMQLVQDIESAMEECLDQDVEVACPTPEDANYVARETDALARKHGPAAVLSLPLRHAGEVVGVLTCERPAETPFTLEEAESLRLTGDLVTSWIHRLHETDRWIGLRAADQTRRGLGWLIGPKHTWAKLAAVAVLGIVLFAVFARGADNVESPYVLEPTEKRIVTVPFDADLLTVAVEPGDTVDEGQVIATLDTADLLWQREQARGEKLNYDKQADQALNDGKVAEQQIALAQAARAQAEVNLLNNRIQRATLTAPVAGRVLTGDWTQQLGRHFAAGDPLFEIAPDSLHAELMVSEHRIVDVAVGQRGELASPSDPDRRVGFTVERIAPVAEVIDGDNVFKVTVTLDGQADWARPRVEGIARIEVGEARYAVLWTRPAVRWIRMKLWW